MKAVIRMLGKLGLFRESLDYQLLRASMVIMYFFFGYQKWFEYEAQVLIPYQQRPADFLVASGFRNPRRHLVF
jgi:uncharacterized membrane protein YkgB